MSRITQQPLEKKSEIAEAIVDAAERLLNSYGYQKMTMTDLAAEAGIGVGTTYLHFARKADVAVAVVDRMHGRLVAELLNLAASDAPPEVRLASMLKFRIMSPYHFVRNKLSTISWQQFVRHGSEFFDDIRNSDPARVAKWKNEVTLIFADVISSGSASHMFITVEPILTAKAMLEATCGFLPKHLEQHDFCDGEQFERRVDSVISLLLNGILYERAQAPFSEKVIE